MHKEEDLIKEARDALSELDTLETTEEGRWFIELVKAIAANQIDTYEKFKKIDARLKVLEGRNRDTF